MGKKSTKTVYYEYFISLSYGMCYGPVDELVQVWFKEKEAVKLGDGLIGSGSVQIDKPDLFGGFEREGGIVGTLEFYSGTDTQLMSKEMADRMGLKPENAPGYRDLCHIFLRGDENSGRPGMSVSCMSPNVPAMWTRLRDAPKKMPGNVNTIMSKDGKRSNANPAAMIYETVLDDHWGMVGEVVDLDVPSFRRAGNTLHDEKFGLSAKWTQQTSIEDFCKEVLNHINGVVYFNPYTGKTVLKLIRNDYDRDLLPVYGPDQGTLSAFKRKLWGETVNEMTVTWTSPEGEEEATITYQDDGNIAMQGATVSETRNYYMIRDEDLAADVCKRDLQVESAPLATATYEVDRTMWDRMPGDVIKFEWPDYNIDMTIMRVIDIDWGTVDSSKIKVSLAEDIFSFELAQFSLPGGGEWEEPGQDPNGPAFGNMPARFFAAPYSLLQQEFGAEADAYIQEDTYPKIVIGCMVYPTAGTYDENGHVTGGLPDLQSFYMWKPTVDTTGTVTVTRLGERQLTGHAVTSEALVQEVRSTIQYENFLGGEPPEVGGYAIIGPGLESEDEWVLIEEITAGNILVVRRGVLDTVPSEWDAGVDIYFITQSFDAYDLTEPMAYVPQEYILQARTSRGITDLENATTKTTTRPDRPYRPYRPANVKIESVMFGGVDDSQKFETGAEDDTWEPRDRWTLAVSWSRRNRTLEEIVVLPWDGGDLMPEEGQTTEIIVYAGRDDTAPEIDRIVGLTGTSTTFDIIAHTFTFEEVCLKFISRRDGFESIQGVTIGLKLYKKGFGSDWGYLYGGWPQADIFDMLIGDIDLPGLDVAGTGTTGV